MKQSRIIPFSRYRYIAFAFSIVVILMGVVFYFINGGIKFGIDFTGGITIQLRFNKYDMDIAKFRDFCQKNGFGSNITQIGGNDSQQYVLRIPATKESNLNNQRIEDFKNTISSNFSSSDYEILAVNLVGPSSSTKMSYTSIIMILVVIILILLYTFIRFKDFKYSFGAVLSIIHDAFFILSIVIIFKRELNSQTLAGILTLLGYSLNDSIVVLSKIKENEFQYVTHKISKDLKKKLKTESNDSKIKISSFIDNIDHSITITLNRTVITALTTLVVALSILILGGIPTRDFAFILSIGLIIGTYSSIYIASPVLLMWGNPSYDVI